MADARLVEYVAGLLKKGYTTQVIRDQLLSHGYDDTTITEAIHTAQGKPHLNVILLFTIIGAVVLVAGIIIGIIALSGPEPNVVLSLTPTAQHVRTGETLTFTLRMTNTIDEATPVQLRHDIIKSDELVQRQTDALTLRGEHRQDVRIALSDAVRPGAHTLRTTLTFDNTEKSQAFDFLVEQGTTPPATPANLSLCSPSCDDFNACTTDTCTDGRCTHTPKASCCGDGICEAGENVLSCNQDCQERSETTSTETIKEEALALLTRDKQRAAQECARIALDYEHDNCFTTLSEESDDPLFCVPIFNTERKDACYLQFALAGDPTICTNIVDPALQQTCFQYGRFAALRESV